jgi:alanyl-tRNA synthetase
MLGRDLRIAYTKFFVERGAVHLPSDSLVPNDPTLLFTSAGMVPFKPFFLGVAKPPASRATSVQKCLRTTDIEDVGDTSHCTFFQMLGNFSFGDYFKKEAIAWAWEFLFGVLKLDIERIRVTIYDDDDEAFEIWRSHGMPERKIFRMGEEHNFWAAGPTGPCGPDSEIFFDTQAKSLPPTPDGVWDDKRWLEIWNLVFMQFDRSEDGVRSPLPRPSIDTGMGLERTTAAINDLRGPFDTDFFVPLMDRLQSLSGKTYGSRDFDPDDIALRRVADHVRAATFCLSDDILPSNVGRGYVLRRIIRRAILAGRNRLGIEKPLLIDAIPTVIEQYAEFYPELADKRDKILRYAVAEESQFRRTLESGTTRLTAILEKRKPGDQVTGQEAFDLFTTHGFPVEMTLELASEKSIGVDMAGYQVKMLEHEETSRGGKEQAAYGGDDASTLHEHGTPETVFDGYKCDTLAAKVVAIMQSGQLVESVADGNEALIVLDRTPFYAEAGGQIGDTGSITGPSGIFDVTDTKKSGGYTFHSGKVRGSKISTGGEVTAQIDVERRRDIMRNHSATHLLHKALRIVLGDHVQQRGSLVAPDRLRFDFSHGKALTGDEIARVESIVNAEILEDLPVETSERGIDVARKMGAMMLFGEKYGSVVRVVKMGEFSLEFCGGTHLTHTSQTGLFRIVGEGSSQAGVRRIEAVTGSVALRLMREDRQTIQKAAAALKTAPGNVVEAVDRLQAELKAKSRELSAAVKAGSSGQVEAMVGRATQVGAHRIVVEVVEGISDADSLRAVIDELVERLKSGAVVLGAVADGRVLLAARASADLVAKGVHAGNIVKAAAQLVGGGGGGRPEAAQAGGKDPAKLGEALEAARALIAERIGG